MFVVSVVQWTPSAPAVVGRSASDVPFSQVRALVKASNQIDHVPTNLTPSVAIAAQDSDSGLPYPNLGYPPEQCVQGNNASSVPACVFGDTSGTRTVVLYGDSHAGMWFQAVNAIAKRDGWKLVLLFKGGCPASLIKVHPPDQKAVDYTTCDTWHRYVVQRIDTLDPDLLIVTQERDRKPNNKLYSTAQWQTALAHLLTTVKAKREVVLGNIPISGGPGCLTRSSVKACSRRPGFETAPYNRAERKAAQGVGATYVDTTPWFCAATTCSPVIGRFNVYYDPFHVAVGYSEYLEGVLGQALGI